MPDVNWRRAVRFYVGDASLSLAGIVGSQAHVYMPDISGVVTTADLPEGPAQVRIDGHSYNFEIPAPNPDASPTQLAPLIGVAVDYPAPIVEQTQEYAISAAASAQAAAEAVSTDVSGVVTAEVNAQVPPAVATEVNTQVPPAVTTEVNAQVPPAVTTEVNTQLPALADPVVADEVAAQVPPAVSTEVASQVPPAVTADIESRNMQIVAGATPGTVQWQAGAALGPEFPANAVLADGISDAGAVGRSVVQATTQAEAQAAMGAAPTDAGTPVSGTPILPRRGTAAQWTAANPVLAMGEMGLETDTRELKIGDGTAPFAALPSVSDDAAARAANVRLLALQRGASVWSNLIEDSHIHSGNIVGDLDRPVSVSAPTVVSAGASNLLNGLLPFTGGTPGTPGTMPTGITKQNASAAKNLNAYDGDTLDVTFVSTSGALFSGGFYFSGYTPPSNGDYLLAFTVECVSTNSPTNRVRVSTWNTNTSAIGDLRNVVYRSDTMEPRRVVSRVTVTDNTNERFFISVDDLETVDATSRFIFSDFMLVALASPYSKYGTLLQIPPYAQESTAASDITIDVPTAGDHMILVKTAERGWITERAILSAGDLDLSDVFPGISFTAEELALIPAGVWQVGDLDVIRAVEWRGVRYHNGSTYALSYPRSWPDVSEMIGDALTAKTFLTMDKPYASARGAERATLHRFEVRDNDQWIGDVELGNTNQRAEIGNGFQLPKNTDVWTSFWVKFDGQPLTAFAIIQQEIAADGNPLSPAFSIGAWPSNIVKITHRTDNGTLPATMAGITTTNTPETVTWTPGKWHRCVVRTNHSTSGAGSFDWWWDGVQIVSNRGPVGYNTVGGPIYKHGIYRADQSATQIVTFQHYEVSTTSLLSRVTAPLPI